MKEIMDILGITVHFVRNRDVTIVIQKLSVYSNRNYKIKIIINRGQVLHLNQNKDILRNIIIPWGLYHLNSMPNSRTISDHEFDHTYTKLVDNKFHSVSGSDMLNS